MDCCVSTPTSSISPRCSTSAGGPAPARTCATSSAANYRTPARPWPGRLRSPRRLPLPSLHHQHTPRAARVPGARHRAHARVEDRIRTGKDTGLGHLPSRHNHIKKVWIELALIAADLLALSQSMLLANEPELHRAEPKTLRYRLLHVAARITHGQRKVFLRLAEHWPWALALAKASTACGKSRSRPDSQATPRPSSHDDHGDPDLAPALRTAPIPDQTLPRSSRSSEAPTERRRLVVEPLAQWAKRYPLFPGHPGLGSRR